MVKKLPTQPTTVKNRLEVNSSGSASVVDSKAGSVTAVDKAKAYYHTIITVLGTLLVFATELSPVTDHLPEAQQHGIAIGILLVTALVNALKSNEVWVNAP